MSLFGEQIPEEDMERIKCQNCNELIDANAMNYQYKDGATVHLQCPFEEIWNESYAINISKLHRSKVKISFFILIYKLNINAHIS